MPLQFKITMLYMNPGWRAIGTWPSDLVSLKLGAHFHQILQPGMLPEGLKQLYFREYNQLLSKGASLTHLNLGPVYNQPLDVWPLSLIDLKVGPGFNQELVNLPGNLQHLSNNCKNNKFNRLILPATLPASLASLYLKGKAVDSHFLDNRGGTINLT